MRWIPAAVITTLVSLACATAPVARDFENLAEYPEASFSEVWDLVIDVFGDRNWAIDNLERESGIIATDWMATDDPSYQDCGGSGIFGSPQTHMGRFNIVVRETDVGVSMRVTTSWRATRAVIVEDEVALTCVSTGVFERELHDEVGRRLGNQA